MSGHPRTTALRRTGRCAVVAALLAWSAGACAPVPGPTRDAPVPGPIQDAPVSVTEATPVSHPPGAGSAPLPRYQTVAELNQALDARLRADRTASYTDDCTVHTQPPLSLIGGGALRLDGAGLAMQSHHLIHTPNSSPTDLWMVLVPGMAYLRTPPEILGLPPARPWLAVPPTGDASATKALGPLVDAVRACADPTALLTRYGSALSLVRASPDQLDATPTMHYVTRLDLGLGQSSATDPATRQALGRILAAGGASSMTIELWLDAHARLTQLELTAPGPSTSTVTTWVRYSNWAAPVTIEVPPANQLARN